MDTREQALALLPQQCREQSRAAWTEDTEEIRLRIGRPPGLVQGGKERTLEAEAVQEAMLQRVLEKATGASLHAASSALAEGYISYHGIRIGVCGTAIVRDGAMCGFRNLSSLAIRVPRECRGICHEAAERLTAEGFRNTLIVGRPGEGKTTALRELIRRLSESGYRIGVADERNELAAADGAKAHFDLGPCTDVITGIGKAEGAIMLLRGMNPQILAMDEITREKDMEAVLQISGCGVGILASAHGTELQELRQREAYRKLLDQHIFSLMIRIHRTSIGRTYTVEELVP